MLRFKKIKFDGSEVTLVYMEQRGQESSEVSKVNKERPHVDFTKALAALCDDVLSVCELGEAWIPAELRVQSVSLSHSEKTGIRGAVVTALKIVQIANSPVVINTPHLTEDGESMKGVMPPGMWRRVLALEEEAKHYLGGKRAPKEQLDIEDAIEETKGSMDGIDTVTISVAGHEPVTMTGKQFEELPDRIAELRS